MTTCRKVRDDDRLRARLPLCPRGRRTHARVALPLVLALFAQAVAVVAAILLHASGPAIVGVVAVVALLTAVVSRRTVSSLVAGAGLRVARPYEPGEQIRVFVPALDAVENAEILRVGPANTTLSTARGIVLVPNVDMLRNGTRS